MTEPKMFDKVYIYSQQSWEFGEWEIVWVSRERKEWEMIYTIEFLWQKKEFKYKDKEWAFVSWIYKWEYDRDYARTMFISSRCETLKDDIDYLEQKIEEYEDKIKEIKRKKDEFVCELKELNPSYK